MTADAASSARQRSEERDLFRVKVNAARVVVVTDRKLGNQTPEWIKQLAEGRWPEHWRIGSGDPRDDSDSG